MFLKRIDLIGFKSFADKTTLEFSPGLTAVVGPNGSGKSNVADAIRWVLGEQSAKSLRGNRMEDVIFAGSETRRAVNFCEVSLTLDNEDGHLPVSYKEVNITRRVYRSGESEYLLNRQPCRLKDILELFMDSGLGRESYSIIGQGRIEEMLSTHPEDRRGPFEDAAGIVKFKHRRKEAERKLGETDANLTRIDDIIAELEREERPLAVEAKRAREYLDIEAELKTTEAQILMHDIDSLSEQRKQLAAESSSLVSQRSAAKDRLRESEEQLKHENLQLEQKQEEMEMVQEQLARLTAQREEWTREAAVYQERRVHLLAAQADRQNQVEEARRELNQLAERQKHIDLRQSEIAADWAKMRQEERTLSALVLTENRTKLERELEELNNLYITWHQEAATARNIYRSLQERDAADSKQRAWLVAEAERLDKLRQEAKEILEANKVMAAKEREGLASMDQRLSEVSQQFRELGKEDSRWKEERQRLRQELAALQSRVELLGDLESGYDGYALGVKTVLQAKDAGRLEHIYGSIANLIRVPKELELAIETALGGAVQNLLVASEEDARRAIEYLKQRHAGRATFMPLSVIRGRYLSEEEAAIVKQDEGALGVASQLLQYHSNYEQAIAHLLGNVVVAKTLVDANRLARKLRYRVRLVTLEGDVVAPGGLMSGGSHARKGPGLLGRTREKQETEERLAELQEKEQQAGAELALVENRMREIERLGQTLTKERTEIAERLTVAEASIRDAELRLVNAEEKWQAVQFEIEESKESDELRRTRLQQAAEKVEETEARIAQGEQQLTEIRKKIQDWDQNAQQTQEQLTALRVQMATLEQEKSANQQRLQELSGEKAKLEQRLQTADKDLSEFAALLAELAEREQELQERLKNSFQEKEEIEHRMLWLRQERQVLESSLRVKDKAVHEARAALAAVEERTHRLAVLEERTDAELRHALEKLGQQYEMTYEWAISKLERLENVEKARETVRNLRLKLQSMGHVRVSAWEEWNRLTERLRFLQSERDDVLAAKAQLLDVIQNLDEQMQERFQATFDQIRSEFQIVFRQLFQGGRADLQLTDPEHLLTTGIEVIAEPPGKKLQSLNLLSGGERALTAMALLFAILRVRPVPFCVLDEVEAALDEGNVGRFAQQLQAFAAATQFIVITHRRGTMEAADVLYGVTMQELGVSSMVSVRIAEDWEDEPA